MPTHNTIDVSMAHINSAVRRSSLNFIQGSCYPLILCTAIKRASRSATRAIAKADLTPWAHPHRHRTSTHPHRRFCLYLFFSVRVMPSPAAKVQSVCVSRLRGLSLSCRTLVEHRHRRLLVVATKSTRTPIRISFDRSCPEGYKADVHTYQPTISAIPPSMAQPPQGTQTIKIGEPPKINMKNP